MEEAKIDQSRTDPSTNEALEGSAARYAIPKQAPPSPPPDGGLRAWLQVAAATCVWFSTWGLINCFGVFQTYYATVLIPQTSNSSISWIGTLQVSLTFLGSIWSGPLSDKGYTKSLIITGSILTTLGMFMTSLAREYWQLILAQGLTVGIGLGTIFTPTSGLLYMYFARRRGLALGIVSAGGGISGIVFPIIFGNLVDRIGFGRTVRVIAYIMLGLLVIPLVVVKQRLKPPKARKVWDMACLREPEFVVYGISLFIAYIGVYVPFYYVQLFAVERGIIKGSLNKYLITILNAGGCVGRPLIGLLADKIGAMNTYSLTTGICAILIYGWIGIMEEGSLIAFIVLYGFFSSGPIIVPNTVVAAALTPDMRFFGVRLTMQLIPSAIGLLIGNPIAGAILPHGWKGLQVFSGSIVTAGCLLSVGARILKAGHNPSTKV